MNDLKVSDLSETFELNNSFTLDFPGTSGKICCKRTKYFVPQY